MILFYQWMCYNHRHLYWCNAIYHYCRCADQGSISGGEYGLHQHSGTGQDRYADQRVGNAVMIMMMVMIDDGDDDGDDDLNSRMIVMIYWCQLNNDYNNNNDDDDDDDSVSFISSTILIILHESL